jgi:Na+-translocating ferredoxin:NAD+ oxidoreductase RnfD subunit
MTIGRFFRTPKGLLIIVLGVLAAIAARDAGPQAVLIEMLAACIPAMAIDVIALRMRRHRWVFPDGALLTAMIVAMIVSPLEPWYVSAVTASIAVASKYVFRARTANVFNPAALALLATFYLFHPRQSWWGALPDVAPLAVVALFATGLFITQRVDRLPAMLSFLGVYFTLVTADAFLGNARDVAGLYRPPDVNAALFFAFFMVTDPPTSPPRTRDQLTFGTLTAIASFVLFLTIGRAYFLLAGLLLANLWESWRRTHSARVSFRP